jgi:glutathione S-transferase
MRLISAQTSPYARKVRIVLAEKKIDCKIEAEDVWHVDTKINEINPLGKVPVLIVDDGGAIFDSRVIVEYLDQLTPVHRMIPPVGRERIEVRTWEALADGLLDAAILVRLENTQRSDVQRSGPWIARQMKKIELSLNAMSRGLGEKEFCVGRGITLADVAVGCALGYLDFRFSSLDWRSPNPNLAKQFDRLMKRPSFIATKPD